MLRLHFEPSDYWRFAPDGLRELATAAGFEVVLGRISPPEVFEAYPRDAITAARAWAERHPDAPETGTILFHADRVQAITDFGRDYIDFGIYLLRNPG
jgi:hypothetical protein